jgi:hypothetical protein
VGSQGIEPVLCRRCCGGVDAVDSFCRRCGFPINIGESTAPTSLASGAVRAEVVRAPSKPAGVAARWSESPWVVLILLFFVLGPLGLPMLWRSRRFSLLWKLLLTALMTAVTILILAMVWYAVYQALAPLRELQQMKF